MEKEDADFLHQLFRENNELRLKYNAAQRELYNRMIQNDAVEEEIRGLKLRLDLGSSAVGSDRGSTAGGFSRPQTTSSGGTKLSAKATLDVPEKDSPVPKEKKEKDHDKSVNQISMREHQEVLFALERKTMELKQMEDEVRELKITLDDQMVIGVGLKKEIQELKQEIVELKNYRTNAIKEAEALATKLEEKAPMDVSELRMELEIKDATILLMKRQAIEMASDADRKQNELQNQLQGVEALIEGIRKEYEEFIQVTKLENESFKISHQNEYHELKMNFETAKLVHFEEKKRLANEYGALSHSMQSQFEEYRTATEYMFSSEIAKLEDELSLQSLKFEHEILYVIQAKDKFYADMMVSKDAKIMNLIEGSDLQTLMQKHELDIENLRKDHAREIDMVKSDQESEQKNLTSLLQRQNLNLESKCEKLQAHLKNLELRIRELLGTIDSKVKLLNDREEARLKLESEYETKLADCHAQIAALSQEKERLRHKVIRLNLNAKGEGGNTIENMIKRISRETTDLHTEFEQLSIRYDSLIGENQVLVKRLKEREKFAAFMEKEVARRTEEYVAMTNTFEEFLLSRARQSRKDRAKKLPKLIEPGQGDSAKGPPPTANSILAKMAQKQNVLKSVIPNKDDKADYIEIEQISDRKLELERGNMYLKKFKTLSRAFATGDFRILPTGHQYTAAPDTDAVPGPWQKTSLYRKMDDANLALARLYKEPMKEKWDPSSKPTLYNQEKTNEPSSRVYSDDTGAIFVSKPTSVHSARSESPVLKKPDMNKQVLVGKSLKKGESAQ